MIDYHDHALLLNESYRHWRGEYLVDQQNPGEVLAALNEAKFALLSHGLETEPVFNYGNVQALTLFGYEHLDFLQLVIRDITANETTAERSALRAKVDTAGFVTQFSGVSVSRKGQRFVVDRGEVWQLIDNLGRVHGQAARLDDWHFLD
jgi:hypothetical protein